MVSPIRARNVNTETLIQRLRHLKVGQRLSYQELAVAIGSDVRGGKGRSWLASARRAVLHEYGVIVGIVTREGVQRLSDPEAVQYVRDRSRGLARTARRLDRMLHPVDVDKLGGDARMDYFAARTLDALVGVVAGAEGRKRIDAGVRGAAGALPTGKTLALFTNGH